ncbi:hypothetical protein [Ligilactobacillus equi]
MDNKIDLDVWLQERFVDLEVEKQTLQVDYEQGAYSKEEYERLVKKIDDTIEMAIMTLGIA